jgi:hypothetical protein
MIAQARALGETIAQTETSYTFITSSSGTTGTYNHIPVLTYLNSTGSGINIHGSSLSSVSSVSSSLAQINETVEEEVELEPEEMEEDLQDEQQFLI